MKKIPYLYILSQRYSGSTLLSFLLANHAAIATIGERRKFYVKGIRADGRQGQICSCGEAFHSCPFWQQLRESLEAKLTPASLRTNFTEFEPFRAAWQNKLWDHLGARHWPSASLAPAYHANEILVREILSQRHAKVFLDSSKTYKHLVHLSRIPAFDLKVIWLTRDPRAQVSSAMKYNDWDVEKAASLWVYEFKACQDVLDRYNLPYRSIRYEALCQNPKATLSALLTFADLPAQDLSPTINRNAQHIMGNGSMRLGNDQEIRERRDWQDRLTKAEIERIEVITKDYHELYTLNA